MYLKIFGSKIKGMRLKINYTPKNIPLFFTSDSYGSAKDLIIYINYSWYFLYAL